jgi:hypothetical protein
MYVQPKTVVYFKVIIWKSTFNQLKKEKNIYIMLYFRLPPKCSCLLPSVLLTRRRLVFVYRLFGKNMGPMFIGQRVQEEFYG